MDKKFDCDVLVVGSGASGMATAITAKLLGLNVVVIEKSKNRKIMVVPQHAQVGGCGFQIPSWGKITVTKILLKQSKLI